MVTFDKVTYEYVRRDEEGNVVSTNKALKDVSLRIKQGDFVAVLGSNGSGKSTFAKHINALLEPAEGDVIILGNNTKDEDKHLAIHQSAGMVFQNPDNQIVASIVEEDVAFGPENMGVPTDELRERVNEALKRVGMSEYKDKTPNKLSGGQKQRIAIAGILAMKPKCIILDEPTAMLDPEGRREVIETIHDLNKKEHITVILITHYMQETVDADRIFVMNNGTCVMEGSPREIFSEVELLKEYKLDVPQVTELAYRLKKAGADLPDCILTEEEFLAASRSLVNPADGR